jgi:group I intron endonuclease
MMIRTKYDNWYYIVYKTTNLINGMIYIGQRSTKNLNDRYIGSGKKFLVAIKEYGRGNFYREILEFCKDKKQLDEREILWVAEFNSTNPEIGYNKHKGGTGGTFKDHHHKEETKEHMRIIGTGRKMSPESSIRKSKANKGIKPAPHTIQASKDACTGKPSWNAGLHWPEEIRQLLREGQLRLPLEVCPYCGFQGKGITMRQFHFDNCLQNPNRNPVSFGRTKESIEKQKDTLSKKPILTCPHCGLQSKSESMMKGYHFDNCKYNPNKNIVTSQSKTG